MAVLSRASVDCVYFETAEAACLHGHGGFCYEWMKDIAPSERRFPDHVDSVMIVMPVSWGEAAPHADQDPIEAKRGVMIGWSVGHKNGSGAQWVLSGQPHSPTLSPSLNWVGVWHGWLRNGRLESC